MRILVEITHPAHVHFFRNAIEIWKEKGHEVAVTARDKDITIALLNEYKMTYEVLSSIGSHKFSLFKELILRDCNLYKFCRKFRPNILTAIGGVFAAHAGFLLRKPVVVWDDSEHASISHKMTLPFASSVQTPDCYTKQIKSKQVKYAGCHELAYLHPNRFTPDANIAKNLGIDPMGKYCIIRFVSWQAHHDVGQRGFDKNLKVNFIKEISKYAKPYITSEQVLPEELRQYQLSIPVHQIHHIMAFASLCVGEGATMASESAVLGVPAVYINTLKLGYINMMEEYGLLKQTTDTKQALDMSLDWLKDPNTKQNCQNARRKLLNDKIDMTEYIVNVIEQTAFKNNSL